MASQLHLPHHNESTVSDSDGTLSSASHVDDPATICELQSATPEPFPFLKLPLELQTEICRKMDKISLSRMMRTSKRTCKAAGPVLYRYIELDDSHQVKQKTPLTGLPVGKKEVCSFTTRIVTDPGEVVYGYKHKLLARTVVLRLNHRSCWTGPASPKGVISFPNLRTLHQTSMETCDVGNTRPEDCHILDDSTKLQTVLVRNDDLGRDWDIYCRSETSLQSVRRLIYGWTGLGTKPPPPRDTSLWSRQGQALDTVNVVLLPESATQPWGPSEHIDPYWRFATFADVMLDHLTHICASDTKSVIIAGAERLGESMWLDNQKSGAVPSSADQSAVLQDRVHLATRNALAARGISDQTEVAQRLSRIQFMTLEQYARDKNGKDELHLAELGISSDKGSYSRPSWVRVRGDIQFEDTVSGDDVDVDADEM